MASAPDADRQAKEFIDRVVETHRKYGYTTRLSKRRYDDAVSRVADTFRSFLAARGRAA